MEKCIRSMRILPAGRKSGPALYSLKTLAEFAPPIPARRDLPVSAGGSEKNHRETRGSDRIRQLRIRKDFQFPLRVDAV